MLENLANTRVMVCGLVSELEARLPDTEGTEKAFIEHALVNGHRDNCAKCGGEIVYQNDRLKVDMRMCAHCAIKAAPEIEESDLKEMQEVEQRLDMALSALEQGAAQFRHYEHLHMAKGTDDGNQKAEVNKAYALLLEDAAASMRKLRDGD